MKKAKRFLREGEENGVWNRIIHPTQHPYYDEGLSYDGGTEILYIALEIAYLEGLIDGEHSMDDSWNHPKYKDKNEVWDRLYNLMEGKT